MPVFEEVFLSCGFCGSRSERPVALSPGDSATVRCPCGAVTVVSVPLDCVVCGAPRTRSCEFPLQGPSAGRTCYLPLCGSCGVARNGKVLCPGHAALEVSQVEALHDVRCTHVSLGPSGFELGGTARKKEP